MTAFKSKIGPELVIPLCLILGGVSVLLIMEQAWPALVVVLLVSAFTIHMLITTYYVIDKNVLTVKCGFLFNRTIQISAIKKIKETNNALSSPAASLDRLEISYGKFDDVMISPKDKAGFIHQLTSANPAIEVVLKERK